MLQFNVGFLNGRDWKGGKMPSQYKNDFRNTDSSPTHILFLKLGYLKGSKKKERENPSLKTDKPYPRQRFVPQNRQKIQYYLTP